MGNGLHQRLSQSERKLSPWESRRVASRVRWAVLFRPGDYLLDYLWFLAQELGMAQRKETPSPAPEPPPPPTDALPKAVDA